jgi:hypothetical protein
MPPPLRARAFSPYLLHAILGGRGDEALGLAETPIELFPFATINLPGKPGISIGLGFGVSDDVKFQSDGSDNSIKGLSRDGAVAASP